MRAVLVSDLHVRGAEPHASVTTASVRWVCEQIAAFRPEVVVMLGDTFHSFTSIQIPDLAVAADVYGMLLRACREEKCELIVLVGNHDQYSRDGTVHSLGFLALADDVVVVNRTPIYRLRGGVRCGFLGYVEEPVRVDDDVEVFFGHIPVRGLGSVPLTAEHSAWLPDQVPGKTAFLGHYHEPESKGKIHVVGSLTAQSFVDLPVDRGIVLLDTHLDPFPLVQRVPNPHTPLYLTMDVRSTVNPFDPPDPAWASNVHIRIRCLETQVEEAARYGAGCCSCQIIPEVVPKQIERDVVSKGVNRSAAVAEYAAARCPEGLDPQKLTDAGIKLLGG